MQRLAFLGSFEIFLEHERLATRQEIAEFLGGLLFINKIVTHLPAIL